MAWLFPMRRNRSFLIKVVLFVPLTWLCVVLYLNNSNKVMQQGAGPADAEQIVYLDNRVPDEPAVAADESRKEAKAPPLRDNQLRKRKTTPQTRGDNLCHKFDKPFTPFTTVSIKSISV
jgi:hypothetical protein